MELKLFSRSRIINKQLSPEMALESYDWQEGTVSLCIHKLLIFFSEGYKVT